MVRHILLFVFAVATILGCNKAREKKDLYAGLKEALQGYASRDISCLTICLRVQDSTSQLMDHSQQIILRLDKPNMVVIVKNSSLTNIRLLDDEGFNVVNNGQLLSSETTNNFAMFYQRDPYVMFHKIATGQFREFVVDSVNHVRFVHPVTNQFVIFELGDDFLPRSYTIMHDGRPLVQWVIDEWGEMNGVRVIKRAHSSYNNRGYYYETQDLNFSGCEEGWLDPNTYLNATSELRLCPETSPL